MVWLLVEPAMDDLDAWPQWFDDIQAMRDALMSVL